MGYTLPVRGTQHDIRVSMPASKSALSRGKHLQLSTRRARRGGPFALVSAPSLGSYTAL